LWTGKQRLLCPWYGLDPALTEHDCDEDTWSGEWPGQADAARLGFWCVWDDRRGWVRVAAGHPGARPDFNRLITEAHWDRKARRWVAPAGARDANAS
jgi:hypothetical protein